MNLSASAVSIDSSWEPLFDTLRPTGAEPRPRYRIWRDHVREFVDTHIAPHLSQWEQTSSVPDELYQLAARQGILGLGFPAALGGTGAADLQERVILAEEMHRLGSGLVFADLATHWVGLPPVIAAASEDLCRSIVEPVLAGEKRICFAVTEPCGGSDVANLEMQAERHKDIYRLRGTKTLITGAMRADFALLVARTGGNGMRGLSLFVVDLNGPGVTRTPVAGLHWYSASVGTLDFDDVEVPAEQLLGEENKGFAGLAGQLDVERLSGVGAMLSLSRYCLAQAMVHCKERKAFGNLLADHQAIKHRLVEMHRSVLSSYHSLDYCVNKLAAGDHSGADLALLKMTAHRTLELCATEAMQMLGGEAYRSHRVERVHRESRVFALAGGTGEVLSEMAARQLGI